MVKFADAIGVMLFPEFVELRLRFFKAGSSARQSTGRRDQEQKPQQKAGKGFLFCMVEFTAKLRAMQSSGSDAACFGLINRTVLLGITHAQTPPDLLRLYRFSWSKAVFTLSH